MKLKYNLKINEINGQYIAVAIGEDAKKYTDISYSSIPCSKGRICARE